MEDASGLETEIDIDTVKSRSLKGLVTLVTRSSLLQIVSTVGFLMLSAFLGRPEIGLFIAVNDLVSILGYFSDVGLAASLIQKKTKVTLTDLRTTFTLQQILVTALIVISLFLSPVIFGYYHIQGDGQLLFYFLLSAFFLASLKTIPSVLLERSLHFEILALVEVVENVLFYVIAVILAWQGRGVSSYAWAVIVRGVVGTAIMYILSPWPIGFSLSRSSLKTLLSFGLPYQINTLMAVLKDRFLNLALWKIIGADGIGIIGWAQTWSQKPLRFIMDNVTKVTFPAFSRLQDQPQALKSGLEKTLFLITLLTFPVVALLATLSPSLVDLFPRYSKWQPALLPLALYCFNSALAAISTPITNTLNALGKVKINTYLMIMWTALTWILVPTLSLRFGYLGTAYATAIIALTSFIPVIIVRRYIKFSLSVSLLPPGLATLGLICTSLGLKFLLPAGLPAIIVNGVLSGSVYCAVIYLLSHRMIKDTLPAVLHVFRRT